MYRYFASKYGWHANIVREMTFAQQAMYFQDEGGDAAAGGGPDASRVRSMLGY